MAIISRAMLMQESLEELSGHSTRQFIDFPMVADNVNRQWREYFLLLSMGSKFLTVQQFKGLPKPTYQTQTHRLMLLWLTLGQVMWLGIAIWWSGHLEKKFRLLF